MIRGGQLALGLARSRPAGAALRFAFGHAAAAVPLPRVESSAAATVYRHPQPCYGTWHHIAVPRRGVRDVVELAHPRHALLRAGLFELIDRRRPAFVLVNAGPRQDVAQVHFHLTDGDPAPDADRADTQAWPSWEHALGQLAGVAGIVDLFRTGFALVQDPTGPEVRLVS